MNRIKPKLFSVMKTYTKEQFFKDVIAGIIVAIIALPLSIALALASGVGPEQGIYTAIVAGFVISFLGGSRVQIAGPTAAFATIVAGIIARQGMDGLIIATIMAGILLIIMGLLRFGTLLKYIPFTITTGFTAGIAVTIVIGQLKDFLGLTYQNKPIETIDKLKECILSIHTINIEAALVGLISIAILLLWPKINKKIPASLIAVLVGIVLVKLLHLKVNTIGSLYEIRAGLPTFYIPSFSFASIQTLLPDAFTIAILAGLESLLSCVVSDGMIGSKHRSNMELIAQGAGNIASALFGGIPATGAIARTAANAKNGGRTPIAGMVHSVTLLLILLVLMPYAALIPMPTIAAILFIVAYNMSEWRIFLELVKTAPKSDVLVLVTTFALTVVFDLVVAIEIGFILAALLFMKRMADVTEVNGWRYLDPHEEQDGDPECMKLRAVPKNTLVYEIVGPMFFAAANKMIEVPTKTPVNTIILRMKGVPAMDATAIRTLKDFYKKCEREHITLIFSHVQPQPFMVMKKSGFYELIKEENFCDNIDLALQHAEEIQQKNCH